MTQKQNLIQSLVAVAFAVGILASTSAAQDAQSDSKAAESANKAGQSTTEKPSPQEKRPTFVVALNSSVDDLTDEQKEKVDALQQEAFAKQKNIYQSVELDWKTVKLQKEIFANLSNELPYKERVAKANEEAGFNEEQANSLKDVGEAYRVFRYEAMQVLTPEQQAKMPEFLQIDFKKSVEMAAKRAAEKAAAEKAAAGATTAEGQEK